MPKTAPKKTRRTVKKEAVKPKRKPKVEKPVWRAGLSAEKYHALLAKEIEGKAKGRGEQIAPNLSQAEYEDYIGKYPDYKDYLLAPPVLTNEQRVKERLASVK